MDYTLLIDGDIIVYRSCAAVEKEIHWSDDTFTLHSTFDDALGVFDATLADLCEQAGTDDVSFAFSDRLNWRKSLWDGYKAHRKGQRKPLAYTALKEYVEKKYESFTFPELEADDVLGILSTRHPDKYMIWSLDKDLMQVPGAHLIDDEVVQVTPEQGAAFHMYQTLVGDASDGYKGCPGVGPKKAAGITEWDEVVKLFEKAKCTEEDALLNARLSRILLNHDYNEEVILWNP